MRPRQRVGFHPFPRDNLAGMTSFENIKAGAGCAAWTPAACAEIVQVTQFGPDALNLVFRVERARRRTAWSIVAKSRL